LNTIMYNNKISRVPGLNKPKGPAVSAKNSKPHVNRYLCRTSEYKPPGSNLVGLAKDNQPSKVVWELQYGLSEKQFSSLSQRFPGVAFVQTGIECHDHPVAHTSYRIVWENVLKKLRPGSLVADVGGNPQHNERFNAGQSKRANPITLDTFVKVMCPKDSIRAKVRWGPEFKNDGSRRWEEGTVYDMYRNSENQDRFSRYDVFLMNHVLYYYEMSEINKMLQMNPDSICYATLHKLPGSKGTINCGEQKYDKDEVTGKVIQTNVETGEYYEHNDPAPWFRKFSYADENGAMAWTVNKGCDDTYIITLTSTDPRLVPENCWLDGNIIFRSLDGERCVVNEKMMGPADPDSADPPPAYGVEEVVLKQSSFLPGGRDDEVRIRITHPDLFKALTNFMLNKPRNHKTLQDLTAKAHREVGNNQYSCGKQKVDISTRDLTLHIAAAWVNNAPLEDQVYSFASAQGLSSVNRNLSGKAVAFNRPSVVKNIATYAAMLWGIKNSSDPTLRVLETLDGLL